MRKIGRPGGRPCARHDGQGDHLDRKRVGPSSDRCRSFAGWTLGKEFRLAEIAAGACRPAASRQTSLRALRIEITFSREGRGGTRIIRISRSHENPRHETVSTVSTVSVNGRSQSGTRCLVREQCANRLNNVDGADGTDAKSCQPNYCRFLQMGSYEPHRIGSGRLVALLVPVRFDDHNA
jgi:hypothetical protein